MEGSQSWFVDFDFVQYRFVKPLATDAFLRVLLMQGRLSADAREQTDDAEFVRPGCLEGSKPSPGVRCGRPDLDRATVDRLDEICPAGVAVFTALSTRHAMSIHDVGSGESAILGRHEPLTPNRGLLEPL